MSLNPKLAKNMAFLSCTSNYWKINFLHTMGNRKNMLFSHLCTSLLSSKYYPAISNFGLMILMFILAVCNCQMEFFSVVWRNLRCEFLQLLFTIKIPIERDYFGYELNIYSMQNSSCRACRHIAQITFSNSRGPEMKRLVRAIGFFFVSNWWADVK